MESNPALPENKLYHEAGGQPGFRHDQGQIEIETNGHKKQTGQQTAERCDLGRHLHAIFGFAKQEAGDKASDSER